MRRLAILLALTIFSAAPAYSQSSPDVEALLDSIFAKDVKTLAEHFPEKFQSQLQELSVAEREQLGREFLVAERMRGEGVSVTRGEAPVLIVMEEPKSTPDAAHVMELVLNKRISDGHESVLCLALRSQQENAERGLKEMQVWMRFESGSWRIVQIIAAPSEALVNFEDDKLVSEFRQSRSSANESSAVGSVRTYNTAAITYASTYEDLGYPANLEVLGGDGPSESTAQHSRLLDSQLTTSPYIKSGYRFEYHPSDLSPIATYMITARPVQYGTTGKRSFFSDETGVIRFTEEDRDATAADQPLK